MGQGAGVIGGMEIPPISEAITGFYNGARSVDPDFPVSSTYIGNFTDAAAAKEAALGMLAEGADFVVPDADVAGLGVYQAVQEAGPEIGTFGVFGDFTEKAPDNVLANYFANYGQGIVNIAAAVKDGTFEPTGNIEFGLDQEDVMWIEFNDSAANPVPEDVRQAVDEAKQRIAAGEVDTLAPIGGAGEAAAAPAPEESGEPFKMGLLVPGSANDEGWNQIAYDALLRIEDELGAEISYVELEQNPASFEKAFRDYASQGYDMVLGHGFEFQDAAQTVSKEYPDTYFFISSSRIYDGNVIGLNTDSSQPFYLMGVMAARLGQGAGVIGGMEIPPISEAITGFINGAKSVDPNYPVSSTYIGNFTDAAAAKEAALGMMAEGADVIIPDADVAGLGVYQAVQEAGPEVVTFGVFGDFTDKAPDNVAGNYFANYGQGIVNIAAAVKDGTFEPTGNIEFGLDQADVMWIEFNENAANPVPEDVRQAMEDAKQQIVAGEVDTLAPIE
jgi:simple sugar transport system substrate-binding protein